MQSQFTSFLKLPMLLTLSAFLAPQTADAAILNASLGGTFTMNMDRNALAVLYHGTPSNPGEFLVGYYDTAASDYTTRSDSSFYLGNSSRTEIPAVNLVHQLSPISASNPGGQAPNRYVQATSPDFAINTDTMTATGVLGMTGVELYRGAYNGSLIYGDYSLQYDLAGQQDVWDQFGLPGAPSGWYLQNNISFAAVAYELANLHYSYADSNNWMLTGDLLLSPVNAGLLQGTVSANVGTFCLGTGGFSGCGQVGTVPVPAALWLFTTGLAGFGVAGFRRGRR